MAKIELFQAVNAEPSVLWRYISTARGLSAWQADHVESDADGKNFTMRWPALGVRMDLSLDAKEDGKKLVLRAGQNKLTLEVQGRGVRLCHEGLEEEDDLAGLACSWKLALTLLGHAATKHPGKSRKVTWELEPMRTTPELLHYYFSEGTGLSAWLGGAAGTLTVGRNYSIDTDKTHLTGEVLLSEEGRDVALSLSGHNDAVLVLRSFPGPEGRRVAAAAVSSWTDDLPDSLGDTLGDGLKRLASQVAGRGQS